MLNRIAYFWGRYPALLYGLSFLMGCCLYLGGIQAVIFPAIVLWIPLALSRNGLLRLLLSVLVFGSGCSYCWLSVDKVELPAQGIYGTAIIEFEDISYKKTVIGPRWFLKGTLTDFRAANGKHYTSLPVKLMFQGKENSFIPSLRTLWKTEGTLNASTEEGTYFFKGSAKSPWAPLNFTWKGYFYEKRQNIKESIKNYIQTYLNNRSGPFLAGMVTGDFDDMVLRHQFGKFGLQHILAISGFHFSLLALALGVFFRFFLPTKYVNIALIVVLTGYFVLLGISPSVIRAWATITFALCAYFLYRLPSGLNLLGMSLLITLLFNPLFIKHMGFQFSFGITAGILLFSSYFERTLERLVPIRPLTIAAGWNATSQHCYIAARGLKSTLALSLAVNIVAIPLVLFHFQAFPLFSLVYNLFFPFLIGISLLLLLCGIFAHAIYWPFGTALHWFNSKYTSFVMGLALDTPPSMNTQWHISEVPLPAIFFLLTVIFAGGCWLKIREEIQYTPEIIF